MKTYIKPSVDVVELETVSVIATSTLPLSEDSVDKLYEGRRRDARSNSYQD
jgi:hypothetical protein